MRFDVVCDEFFPFSRHFCEYFLRQMLLLDDGFGGSSYRTDLCVYRLVTFLVDKLENS